MKLICVVFLAAVVAVCLVSASEEEQSADYLYSRAIQLSMNGSYMEALESLNKALDLDSSNLTLLNLKGKCWPLDWVGRMRVWIALKRPLI